MQRNIKFSLSGITSDGWVFVTITIPYRTIDAASAVALV
jgi:hypothetical protein